MLIEWIPALSVDIGIIDEQHKKLFGYVNELYDALEQGKAQDVLIRIFDSLEEYTKTHFSLEEAYFEKFGYAEKEQHIAQHQNFIKKLGELRKQILTGNEDVEDLLDFLVDWLMHHIKGTDHMYVQCFHEHGLN
jgi:hemerythrin